MVALNVSKTQSPDRPIDTPLPDQLIVIDDRVQSTDHLLAGIQSNAKAVVLSGDRDGVTQITAILQDYQHLQSLHILSHGSPNCLYLGNGQLDLQSIEIQADQLRQWRQALAPNGEILLYGCNVAADLTRPTALIEAIHRLTGAEIAASTGPTGSPRKGGSWALAAQTGPIHSPLAFSSHVRSTYPHLLGVSIYDPATNPNPLDQGFLTYGQVPTTPIYAELDGDVFLTVPSLFDPTAVTAVGAPLNTSGNGFFGTIGLNVLSGLPAFLPFNADFGYAGFTNHTVDLLNQSLQPVSSSFPDLDPDIGFTLAFDLAIANESSNPNRAGVSLTLVTSDATREIEIGLKEEGGTDRIFAQNANFNEAEDSPLGDISLFTAYRLQVQGNQYTLFADGTQILTGALRNYNFDPTTSSPPFPATANPYATNNFLFFGDNTDQANADFTLGAITVAPRLVISEIMYDPNSPEDDWEWIEVYNPSNVTVDLSGYVLDDENTLAQLGANIASGFIPAGGTAILYNSDDLTEAEFEAAWGPNLNLIGVTDWNRLQINNDGDKVSLWESFAAYSVGGLDNLNHDRAITTVDYGEAGFPDPVGTSIYLTDLTADSSDGANWSASTVGGATPLGTGATSLAAGSNTGNDIGSVAAALNLPPTLGGTTLPLIVTDGVVPAGPLIIGGITIPAAVIPPASASPFETVVITDPDSPVTVTVSLDDPAKGGFTPASLAASGFIDLGGGIYRLGPVAAAAAQANIRLLAFDAAENFTGPTDLSTLLTPPLDPTLVTQFTITVTDGVDIVSNSDITVATLPLNDAPILDNTGDMVLNNVDQDNADPPGTDVAALIASAGGDRITDADPGALEGIAVMGVDNTNGTWQFSIDNGTTWTNFGTPSEADTRLLAANGNTQIRFVPNAGFTGTVANGITFRAWDADPLFGTNGATADIVAIGKGGVTPFSVAIETADITVTPLANVAPTLGGTALTQTITDTTLPGPVVINGFPVDPATIPDTALPFSTVTITDPDSPVTVTVTTDDPSKGTFTPASLIAAGFTDLGGSVYQSGSVAAATAQTNIRLLEFDATANLTGPADLAPLLNPPLDANLLTTFSIAVTDGTATANSNDTTVYALPINDAPVLDNTGAMALTDVAENDADPPGTTVTAIIASAGGNRITDADPGALEGIAVTGVDNTNGTWQFSTDNGTIWTDFGIPSEADARLLAADGATPIRFIPNAGFSGTVANGITFRAWDKNPLFGTNGDTANIATAGTGGLTPFSVATETTAITITPGPGITEIIGTPNPDVLNGDNNANRIRGLADEDILNGGGGNDILIGGLGHDTLTGGAGNDRFVYERYSDRIDTITDFEIGNDLIDLSLIFANPAYGNPDKFNTYVDLVQRGGSTEVEINTIGDNPFIDPALAFRTLVILENVNAATLTAARFIL